MSKRVSLDRQVWVRFLSLKIPLNRTTVHFASGAKETDNNWNNKLCDEVGCITESLQELGETLPIAAEMFRYRFYRYRYPLIVFPVPLPLKLSVTARKMPVAVTVTV